MKVVIKMEKRELYFLLGILLVSIIFRAFWIEKPNELVFDEFHYVKAAQAILKGQLDPNWISPPLGKLFMVLSMGLLGDNPIGWRFFSFVFGIASLLVFYFLAKKVTNSVRISLLALLLLSLDPMHLIQSRTAMLDIYFFFFLLAAIYFSLFEGYWVALSGFLLGLSIATKWPAALGLPAILLYLFFTKKLTKKKILFLVLMPLLAYSLAYIPTIQKIGPEKVLKVQKDMLSWQSTTNATHPYSSPAWSWFLFKRPVWYYFKQNLEYKGIVALGNPVIWWFFIPCFIFVLKRFFDKREKMDLFIIISFLCFFVPWLFLPRLAFMYYMLIVSPAISLAIARVLDLIWRKPFGRWAVAIYLALVVLVFLALYPLFVGYPISLPLYLEYIKFIRV